MKNKNKLYSVKQVFKNTAVKGFPVKYSKKLLEEAFLHPVNK